MHELDFENNNSRQDSGSDGKVDFRRLAGVGSVLSLLTVFGQITGLLRESTIAYFLGTKTSADMYIAAFVPIDVITSAILLSIPVGFTPLLLRYQEEFGTEISHETTRKLRTATTLFFVLAAIVAIPFGEQLVGIADPHLGKASETAVRLFYWMLPAVVFASNSGFSTAQLIANDQLIVPGFNQLLLNLSIVGAGIIGWRFLGVQAFGIGVSLGFLFQFSAQRIALRFHQPFKKGKHTSLRHLRMWNDALSMLLPTVLLYTLGGLLAIVPRRFASGFGNGQLAVFGYAYRAVSPLYLLGFAAMSYPYFSSFARCIAREETDSAVATVRSMIRSIFLFAIPATAGLFLIKGPLVRILFQRGAFDPTASSAVISTVGLLCPCIGGALLVDMMGRCLVAMRKVALSCVLYAVLFGIACTIVAIFSHVWGFAGIPIGFAVSFWLAAPIFLGAVDSHLGRRIRNGIGQPILAIAASGIVASIVMWLVSTSIETAVQRSRLGDAVEIAATLGFGTLVYLTTAHRLRVTEVAALVDVAGRAFNKMREKGV